MLISQSGIDLIKSFEALDLNVYQDKAGKLTIGYGHKLLSAEHLTVITLPYANYLLMKDLSIAENAINELAKEVLLQCQFDALCSFVFNVGVNNFKNSMMLKYLNECNNDLAAQQFQRWIYIDKINVCEGLVERRQKEMNLFLGKTL